MIAARLFVELKMLGEPHRRHHIASGTDADPDAAWTTFLAQLNA